MTFSPPPRLEPGQTIAVIAPASPFDRNEFTLGIKLIEDLGFRASYNEEVFASLEYLAGSDEQRLTDLTRVIESEEVAAILPVRGGFGTMRLLQRIDYERIAAKPKIWLGFSDITSLHSAIGARCGLVTFHSPVLTSLPRTTETARNQMLNMLQSPSHPQQIFPAPVECWRKGHAEGTLIGGNLTQLTHLIGTRYMPKLDGTILALEDVNEEPYKIDRSLTHLDLASVFSRIAGVLCGQYSYYGHYQDNRTPELLKRRICELAERYDLPVLGNCPFGHVENNFTLPLGVRVSLDATEGNLITCGPTVS